MDPVTGTIILGIISSLIGAGAKATQEIIKHKKEQVSRQPNPKNYPTGTTIGRAGKGPWMITEPGKKPYAFQGSTSPVKFSDDAIKQIDSLPVEQRTLVNSLIDIMQADPQAFSKSLESVSPEAMEQIAQGKLPSAQQLGFPPNTNIIDQLMKDTDFAGIEQHARKQFNEQTIPGIAERFAGLGGLHSTALKGELGKAGSNLESQLAGLRSQYGLQRANALGSLSQKQQALDTGRAQAVGNLGLAQQGQQFGQQQAIANLGLQNNQQQLSSQQQQSNLLSSLLGQGRYDTTNYSQNPGLADYALGGGLSLLGTGLQGYMQNQGNQNLIDQLNALSKKP